MVLPVAEVTSTSKPDGSGCAEAAFWTLNVIVLALLALRPLPPAAMIDAFVIVIGCFAAYWL